MKQHLNGYDILTFCIMLGGFLPTYLGTVAVFPYLPKPRQQADGNRLGNTYNNHALFSFPDCIYFSLFSLPRFLLSFFLVSFTSFLFLGFIYLFLDSSLFSLHLLFSFLHFLLSFEVRFSSFLASGRHVGRE